MKPARANVDRDITPANVTIRWPERLDDRRRKRVAEILASILDNETTPGESGQR